jgi:brefeldin A-inhibited guanine nucleotide-exchange protein
MPWRPFNNHLLTTLQKELEVFLKEIYLAILERKNSPSFQKQYFMEILERLAADPRALVELYLNYDCDSTALENIFQGYFHLNHPKRNKDAN